MWWDLYKDHVNSGGALPHSGGIEDQEPKWFEARDIITAEIRAARKALSSGNKGR